MAEQDCRRTMATGAAEKGAVLVCTHTPAFAAGVSCNSSNVPPVVGSRVCNEGTKSISNSIVDTPLWKYGNHERLSCYAQNRRAMPAWFGAGVCSSTPSLWLPLTCRSTNLSRSWNQHATKWDLRCHTMGIGRFARSTCSLCSRWWPAARAVPRLRGVRSWRSNTPARFQIRSVARNIAEDHHQNKN